jgi:hypothetical protein
MTDAIAFVLLPLGGNGGGPLREYWLLPRSSGGFCLIVGTFVLIATWFWQRF